MKLIVLLQRYSLAFHLILSEKPLFYDTGLTPSYIHDNRTACSLVRIIKVLLWVIRFYTKTHRQLLGQKGKN